MCMSIIWRIIGTVSIILQITGKEKNKFQKVYYVGRFWSTIDFKNVTKFLLTYYCFTVQRKCTENHWQVLPRTKLHYIKITYSTYHVTVACRKVEVFTCQRSSYRGRGSGRYGHYCP